jgi:methionyl-tRNA synthetase
MSEETPNPVNREETPNRITIDEFARVQLRVGQVLEAEKIEGSRKLLKLRVDIGTEVRQVVAGIAEAYEPESLLRRKIVIVANLKPARLMGVESNGMVVAATADGKPVLATFAEDVPNGALLK